MLHRKAFLRAYLNKLCSDPSKLDYWKYCNKVGMMHVGLGREHPLHVEYIHLGATLGLVQEVMTEAILSHPRLSLGWKIKIVKALGKVIWIQNDFMAKWHVRDGEEFVKHEGGEQDHPAVEPEGYLDGKKILEDVSEEEENGGSGHAAEKRHSNIPRPTSSACPFSGMSRDMQSPKAGGHSVQHGSDAEAPIHTIPIRAAPAVLPRLASHTSAPNAALAGQTSQAQ